MCLYGSKMFAREKSEHYGSEETLSITIILPHQDRGTGAMVLGGPWSLRGAFGTFIPALHANSNKPTQQGALLMCCYSSMEMQLLAPLRKESV